MRSSGETKRYVRFEHSGGISYGLLNGNSVQELAGSIYDGATLTGRAFAKDAVRLLVPCEPSKVIAVGLNYASHRVHVESSEGVIVNAAGRPVPSTYPGVFAKFPTSLIPDGEDIVFPGDATNVHFEGELVLIVGKKAKHVPVE